MKKTYRLSPLLSVFLTVVSNIILLACTNEDATFAEFQKTANGQIYTYRMIFQSKMPSNNSTRGVISDKWVDGCKLEMKFKKEGNWISGTATYDEKKDEWTIQSPLPASGDSCTALYLDNPDNKDVSPFLMAAYKGSSKYVFNESEKTIIVDTLTLHPATCRLRFKGSKGMSVKLFCRNIFDYDSRPMTDSLILNIGSEGFSPYMYCLFANADVNSIITIKTDNEYSKTVSSQEIKMGRTKEITIPTVSNYESEGWTRGLIIPVKDSINVIMVPVEAGEFIMGNNREGEKQYSEEIPPHPVRITNNYYIGQTEVTQELWEVVMGSNPSSNKGKKLPVEQVSWDDCQEFIKQLNILTDNQYKFRLPTEAEWEFAARGGNSSGKYKYSGSDNINEVAWYRSNSNSQTNDVATKKPNELGIYDMSGNVWEWCSDINYIYDSIAQIDPMHGGCSNSFRMVRGGKYNSGDTGCTVYNRDYEKTHSLTLGHLGMRLAMGILPEEILKVSQKSLFFDKNDQERQIVKVISNVDWTVSSNQDWCEVSSSNDSLFVKIKDGSSTTSYYATITIETKSKDKRETIVVEPIATLEAVDLGLPSGLLWANMNVGAKNPEGYGLYFAWGDSMGYVAEDNHSFDWANYKWMNLGEPSGLLINKYQYADKETKGCWYDSNGNYIGDNKFKLEAEDDAATANMGVKWRMPAYEEFKELIDECDWTWTTQKGVNGYKVTSKTKKGNSIFLPAAGFYHERDSSSINKGGQYWMSQITSFTTVAGVLYFDVNIHVLHNCSRYWGNSVRPVQEPDNNTSPKPAAPVAVDLGLPSGTKWANMNVGASKPEDYGLYFAWGETKGYTSDTSDGRLFDWASYKWMTSGESDWQWVRKYQVADGETEGCWYDGSNFVGDGKTTLELADDAARANWGGQWVMPTYEDMRELFDNTTNEWTTLNGVSGRTFTSKTNGNSIFLPAAGWRYGSSLYLQSSRGLYWSSSVYPSYSYYARALDFYSGGAYTRNDNAREIGQSVRPVLRN